MRIEIAQAQVALERAFDPLTDRDSAPAKANCSIKTTQMIIAAPLAGVLGFWPRAVQALSTDLGDRQDRA